jgi:glycosyltransferase involved in cell wall biosynthesis
VNNNPLVSIICVSYNHERFVAEAILSVLNQSYKNIELIVVDDGSTDNSVEIIKKIGVRLIALEHNGYTAAFNEAWKVCKGDFIIDLAADDVLPPERVRMGVDEFSKYGEDYGVQFGDVLYMTEDAILKNKHSEKFPYPPQGDVYLPLITKYFVVAASQMIRRSVLKKLNGFDETLAYEDFDFWIRSSREFKYFYTPGVLVKKRIVKGSMSDNQFRKGSEQQLSTYRVCEKILALNKSAEENSALKKRLWYELRQSLLRTDFALAGKYFQLLKRIQ